MDGSTVMDWKDKLWSSDAARANPERARRLIEIAEAALAGDTRALAEGMEETLASESAAPRRQTVRRPGGDRANDEDAK